MRLKKVLAAAAAVLMMLTMLPAAVYADTALVEVTQPSATRITAGKSATLEVWVKNICQTDLDELEVKITDGLSSTEIWAAGESSDDLQPSSTISTIKKDGRAKVSFTLEAADRQANQTKALTVSVFQDGVEIGKSGDVFVEIQESQNKPEDPDAATAKSYPVRIDNGSKAPILQKGLYFRSVTLDFEIPNSTYDQYDTITATVGQPTTGGIELENMEYEEMLIDAGSRKTRSMRVRVRALPDAAAGFYTLPITITAVCADGYKAPDGSDTYTYQLKSYVKVTESDNSEITDFYVSKYQVDKEDIQFGDEFGFSVDIVNTGTEDLENVQVRLAGFATETLTLVDDTDVKYIGVESGKTQTVSFQLAAGEKIGTGRYPLTITATYTPKTLSAADENSTEAHTETVTAFIMVTGKPEEDEEDKKQEKPVIIIDSYSYGGESVTFGSEFPLEVTLLNTSTNATIRNLKVTLSDENGVFSPTKSSNTFFIQSIAPGASVKKTIEFMASYPVTTSENNAKSYTITVAYEYEAMADGKLMDTPFTSNEVLSIPLIHTDRFSVGDLYVDTETYVGQQSFVNLSFINQGKSTVYNLSVQMKGENMTVTDGNYYVGNLASGTQDSFEAYFTPIEPGSVSGTITFTYEDANNAPKEVVKEFTTNAIGFDQPMDDGGMGEDIPAFDEGAVEPPAGPNVKMIAVIGAAAVVVAAVGTVVIVKVIKKRRSKDEDEDL